MSADDVSSSVARRFASHDPLVWALALAGATLGVVSKWSDQIGASWLANATIDYGVWIALVFFVGCSAPSVRSAVIRSVALFVPITVAYSGYAVLVLDFPLAQRDWAWLVVAAAGCPLAASVVQFASRRVVPGVVVAGATAALLLGGFYVQRWWLDVTSQLQGGLPVEGVVAAINFVCALGVVLSRRKPAQVLAAGALAVLLTPAVAPLLDQLVGPLHLG